MANDIRQPVQILRSPSAVSYAASALMGLSSGYEDEDEDTDSDEQEGEEEKEDKSEKDEVEEGESDEKEGEEEKEDSSETDEVEEGEKEGEEDSPSLFLCSAPIAMKPGKVCGARVSELNKKCYYHSKGGDWGKIVAMRTELNITKASSTNSKLRARGLWNLRYMLRRKGRSKTQKKEDGMILRQLRGSEEEQKSARLYLAKVLRHNDISYQPQAHPAFFKHLDVLGTINGVIDQTILDRAYAGAVKNLLDMGGINDADRTMIHALMSSLKGRLVSKLSDEVVRRDREDIRSLVHPSPVDINN